MKTPDYNQENVSGTVYEARLLIWIAMSKLKLEIAKALRVKPFVRKYNEDYMVGLHMLQEFRKRHGYE